MVSFEGEPVDTFVEQVIRAGEVMPMSRTGRAQNELEQELLEIGRIEQRLCWLRERATKLSHYIEIARDYAVRPRAWVGEENGSARGGHPEIRQTVCRRTTLRIQAR